MLMTSPTEEEERNEGGAMLKKSIVFLSVASFFFANSCSSPAAKTPIEAIRRLEGLAGFPTTNLAYIGTTTMINSPRGDLQVELYQDGEGRKFYVEPETNIVVEMDARDLLGSEHPGSGTRAAVLTQAELASRVEEFVRAAVPEFSSL